MIAEPVFAAIPASRPVAWAGSQIEATSVSETEVSFSRLDAGAATAAWSLTIDVADGDPLLALGGWQMILVAERYLLVRTEAAYTGGAGRANHRLHHISRDGRLLWSLPYQAAEQVGLYDDRLLVVRFLSTPYDHITQPPLIAHLIEPYTGQSLASRAILIPSELLPNYEKQRGGALSVRLEHDGSRFVVRTGLLPTPGSAGGPDAAATNEFLHLLNFGQAARWSFGFVCPECLLPGALQITRSIQLPADNRSDDIALQVIVCQGCGFRGLAVYEESRWGALDSEAWEHTGYRAAASSVARLTTWIGQCPNPDKAGCACAVHALLGTTSGGRWKGLQLLEPTGAFPMRLVRS